MAEQKSGGVLSGVLEEVPTDELKEQARELMTALGEHAMSVATDKADGLTGRLLDFVENGGLIGSGSDGGSGKPGGSGGSLVKKVLTTGAEKAKEKIMDKVGGGSGGGRKNKTTDIIEQIEVGVPLRVAYDAWTQFQDFPRFTKRIESVEQESDEKVTWKAGIYFSHRSWKSTIVEQVPDERIVWHSQGDKGYVDGTVTFHEIAPNLTKILLVLEYHPQGLFERTGNAFRSQRRRARLELHQFDRHVMRQIILDQDEVEGWRGEIRDGEVVRSHEEALDDEEDEDDEETEESEKDDESQDEGEDEDEEDDAYEDEYEDDEVDDENDDEDEEWDNEPEDEDDEEDEEAEKPKSAKRSRSKRREPAGSR